MTAPMKWMILISEPNLKKKNRQCNRQAIDTDRELMSNNTTVNDTH